MLKLYNTADQFKAAQIIDALKDAGIAAYQMEDGGGSYTNIVMGLSVGGYDIYVDESQYEDAQKYLKLLDYVDIDNYDNITYESDNDLSDDDTSNDYDEEKAMKKVRLTRQLFVLFILLVFILPCIIINLLE